MTTCCGAAAAGTGSKAATATTHCTGSGRSGHDRLRGDAGNDTIIGADSTTPPAHGQSETLFGGTGNDTLLGRAGDDILYDLDGFADSIDGGDGNDSAWSDGALDEVDNVETIV